MENKKNFYIDGKWVTAISKEEIKVINPATEEECAVISLGNKEDVDLAVNAAKKAYSSWAFSPKEERIRLLEKLYENYKKRWADIAEAITIEMGAPKDFATKLQAGTGAAHLKSFIKYLKNFEPDIVFVCVPTPMNDDGTQNIQILESVVNKLHEFKNPTISSPCSVLVTNSIFSFK